MNINKLNINQAITFQGINTNKMSKSLLNSNSLPDMFTTKSQNTSFSNKLITKLKNSLTLVKFSHMLKHSKLPGGKARFNKNDISKIISKINPVNQVYLEPLINATDLTKEHPRFNGKQIAVIMSKINDFNKTYIPALLDSKCFMNSELHDIPRFYGKELCEILATLNRDNVDCLKILVDAKKKVRLGDNIATSDRFVGPDISDILKACNSKSHNILKSLLKQEDMLYKDYKTDYIISKLREA